MWHKGESTCQSIGQVGSVVPAIALPTLKFSCRKGDKVADASEGSSRG
ncbi:MAG: hypothetical protein HZLCBSQH_000552 [Candidatus Fervidibacterota bacterium]